MAFDRTGNPLTAYEKRRSRLVRQLKHVGSKAMLVTHPTNVTYLTGFTGEDSYLLMTKGKSILLSDSRFTTQIQEECPELDVAIRKSPTTLVDLTARKIRGLKLGQVSVEADRLTLSAYESLQTALPQVTWQPTRGLVERLRMIKDKSEVAAIRRAVRQAERALRAVTATMMPDDTELDVVRDIEFQIRRFGGVGCSFPPIVGVGPRAALPHAPPTTRKIVASDFVLIDWGAREGQYISDLTRVFVTGKISPKLERKYALVC